MKRHKKSRKSSEPKLPRRKRISLLLNDKEYDAISRYVSSLRGVSRSSVCREAIMEKVLIALAENQPTLF